MRWLESVLVVLCILGMRNADASVVNRHGGLSALTQKAFDENNLKNIINSHVGDNSNVQQFGNFVCGTKQVVSGILYAVHYHGNCGNSDCAQCIATVWKRSWLSVSDEVTVKCGVSDAEFLSCQQPRVNHKLKFTNNADGYGSEDGVLTMGKRPEETDQSELDMRGWFNQFIRAYNRTYSASENSDEYQVRYGIFRKNFKKAQTLNAAEQGSAIYGITNFMDYSEEEYKKYLAPGFTSPKFTTPSMLMSAFDISSAPASIDWRTKGAVTPVKNQGQCGSCWAFSTTGNIEGQWFLKRGKLWSLSEQELVDCDKLDEGCNGGLPANAYKSVESLGGLETEKDYPYDAEDETCHVDKSEFEVYINSSVAFSKDEVQLAAAVAKMGPISIGINAHAMQFYTGGISHPSQTSCSPLSLDHGVLIVGYGSENGTPFWIIKNSWGPEWGEQGYYRIYRGDGSCGVNLMATSSIVD